MRQKQVWILSTIPVILGLIILGITALAQAQTGDEKAVTAVQIGSGFTFQGQLQDNGSPFNGRCDIRAGLWDAVEGGVQLGNLQTVNDVLVGDGRFTVTLNANNEFGTDAFTGQARWLQIAVRCPAGSGSYATLRPRQPLTAAPYAQSLLPGAVISGSVGAPTNATLSLSNFDDNGVGLRIPDSRLAGIYIDRAGADGVFIGSAQRTGVFIDSVQEDGIFICTTGNQTTCFADTSRKNGIEIGRTQHDGIRVGVAGSTGLYVGVAGSTGLYVGSANSNGVDVAGANLAGYFYGPVQITGGCTGCTLANFGINTGETTLEPGDVVVLTGSQTGRVDSTPILMEVAQGNGQDAVVGVVMGQAEEITIENPRPNEEGTRLIPRVGAAKPGEFVTIVTYGLAPVRVDSRSNPIAAGQRLTAGNMGVARPLQTVEVNGVIVNEAAPVLGIALEAEDTDGDGLVWVLVNPS